MPVRGASGPKTRPTPANVMLEGTPALVRLERVAHGGVIRVNRVFSSIRPSSSDRK